MKRLKIILTFYLLLIVFSPSAANAGCSWSKFVPSRGLETNISECTKNKLNDADKSMCSDPEPSTSINEVTVCCCGTGGVTDSAPPKEPVFTVPIPEIKIPTVELSEVKCELGADNTWSCPVPWIGEYINGIYKYGLNIAAILAALVLMGGGLLWLISGGDSSRITQAKDMIIGSITGLVILMSSYIILTQVNPDLIKMKSLGVTYINQIQMDRALAKTKLDGTAESYKNSGCATEAELAKGVAFYATGYFKMPWQDNQDLRYLCMVHMQGDCPNGTNTNSNCMINGEYLFPSYPNYQPCNKFDITQYAKYFNRSDLIVGETIAGPIKCGGKLTKNNQVCFNGKTYKITDSGGGIQGKRIDILSSTEKMAIQNTKIGILKSGPCP